MRTIHDLTTEEAYHLARDAYGVDLPPLDAIENEDWGRDYVLQKLLEHVTADLQPRGPA